MTQPMASKTDIASEALSDLLDKRTGSSSKAFVGIMAGSILLASQVWGEIASSWIGTWMLLVLLSQVARIKAEKWSASDAPIARRARWSTLGSIPAGLAFGSSVLFFPFEDKGAQSLHTLILLTLVAVSVVYTSGNPGPNRVFSISITLPTILGWAYEGLVDKDWAQWVVAGLIVIYAINVRSYALDQWQMFLEAAQLRSQLRARAEDLQAALQAAELANQAKTRFLASASHDLRQPIHTISVLTSALKLRHADGRSADVLGLLDAVVLGLSHLLDDLLDISKLDAGVVQISKQVVPLGPIIQDKLKEFEHDASAKGIALTCQIHDALQAGTDPFLLERMLRNVLHNALKFTDRGSIQLSLRLREGKAEIACQDSGMGIPTAQLTAVFDEFHQLNNPQRDREKGLGLGLSIVKRLANLLDIEVQLESTLEVGTCVRLRLPLSSKLSARKIAPPDAVHRSAVGATALSQRVLIVDDEHQICESTRILLEELGYACQIAHDSLEANAIIERWQPHIMLTDYRLTRSGDGLDFAVQQRTENPRLRIIMITGDTGPGPLQDITQAGLTVLHKPVSLPVLTRALTNNTSVPSNQATPVNLLSHKD